MKHAKKLASLLLALVMVFALATTAFAAGTAGKITISNPVDGQTYKAYLMFELESYNTTANAYSYKITNHWREFVTTGAGKDYFSIDDQDNVTLKDGVTVANDSEAAATIAKAAVAYATTKNLTPTATLPENNSYTADNLMLGYYVVDSSMGALCDLTTTNPEATIQEKNEAPTVEKTVKEGNTYGKTSDGEIGDTVEFRTIIHAKVGASGYVLKDKMDQGLTFTSVIDGKDNIVIKVGDSTLEKGGDKAYTVSPDSNGNTFEITFNNTWLENNITEDKDIVVTYSASINAQAVVAGNGNVNETYLKYGEANETTHDKTRTYTWEVDIFKYANGSEDKPLAGATFKIVNSDKTKAAFFLNSSLYGWFPLANGDDADAGIVTTGSELTTTETGKLEYAGFDAGTYYLVETQAPDGYNKLKEPVAIHISSTEVGNENEKGRTATVKNAAKLTSEGNDPDAKSYVKVVNKSGTELPSTGGMGTTIFYILGSILVVGAVVLLVTKKRMNSAER